MGVMKWSNLLLIVLIRSDEGLTLETSAFQIFHGGNSTFINSFDNTQIFVLISPTNAAPRFLEKVEPLTFFLPITAFFAPATAFTLKILVILL